MSGPIWALLPPNKLPAGEDYKLLLGAIVPDHNNPAQNTIPEDASKIIPQKWVARPTEDGRFRLSLSRVRTQDARTRLGQILDITFNKSIKSDADLTSTKVKTYALKQEAQVFKLLKQKFQRDILLAINDPSVTTQGTLYFIVAIKTCFNANISMEGSEEQETRAGASAPGDIDEGEPTSSASERLTVDGHVAQDNNAEAETSHIANGERIFAVQYRLVRLRSNWLGFPKPQSPVVDLGKYYVPVGPAMYGSNSESDDSEDEIDESDEEEERNPLEMGDIEYTWSLSGMPGEAIMTEL